MPVSSLSQLATKQVVNYIHDGTYNNFDYCLDSNLSNEIYSRIRDMKNGRTSKLFGQITKKFQLTKVDFSEYSLTMNMISFLEKQNLISLALGNMKKFSDDTYNNIYDNDKTSFDIIWLLKKALNIKCRQHLKQLDIKGDMPFRRGWTKKIGEVLPSLESLIISGRTLRGFSFIHLCNSCSNLRSLDVSNTGITNIVGISNLKNLEILAIREVQFSSHLNMIGLFYLKNLKVLDISRAVRNAEDNIVKQYLECKMSLPKLKFLDCSGTDINMEKMEELKNSHKGLKTAAVINTVLRASKIPGLFLLNYSSTQSTLDTLIHYNSLKRESAVYLVLTVLSLYLPRLTEKINENVTYVRVFLKNVSKAMQVFPKSKRVHCNSLKCLIHLLTEPTIRNLSHSEVIIFVDKLLKTVNQWPRMQTAIECRIHIDTWRILNKPAIRQLPNLKVDELCWAAMKRIAKRTVPALVSDAVSFLGALIHKMSIKELSKMSQEEKYTTRLMDILKVCIESSFHGQYRWTIIILCNMSNASKEARLNLIKTGKIKLFFQHLECDTCGKASDIYVLKMLRSLYVLMKRIKLRVVFNTENINKLTKLIDGDYSIQSQLTGRYLITERAFNAFTILAYLSLNFNEKDKNSVIKAMLEKKPKIFELYAVIENFQWNKNVVLKVKPLLKVLKLKRQT